MTCSLSTHVLDTAAGKPAVGVQVPLQRGGGSIKTLGTLDLKLQ